MKKRLVQIWAFLVALVVLIVSMDWDIKFHYCTIDHELTGSFSETTCEHCVGHHHDHHEAYGGTPSPHAIQFNAKCCCDEFEQIVHLSDNYSFSSEKPLLVNLPFVMLINMIVTEDHTVEMVLRYFTREKIPYLITGRLKRIFFSNLKLFPLHTLNC